MKWNLDSFPVNLINVDNSAAHVSSSVASNTSELLCLLESSRTIYTAKINQVITNILISTGLLEISLYQ